MNNVAELLVWHTVTTLLYHRNFYTYFTWKSKDVMVASAVDMMLSTFNFVRNKREETYFIHKGIIFLGPMPYILSIQTFRRNVMPPYSRSANIMRKQTGKYQAATWLHIPADCNLHIHRRKNITPNIFNKLHKNVNNKVETEVIKWHMKVSALHTKSPLNYSYLLLIMGPKHEWM